MKMTPRSRKPKKEPVFSQKEKDFMDQLLDAAVPAGWMAYHTYDSRRSTAGFPALVPGKPPVVVFADLKTEKGRTSKEQEEWLRSWGSAPICRYTSGAHPTGTRSKRDWDSYHKVPAHIRRGEDEHP